MILTYQRKGVRTLNTEIIEPDRRIELNLLKGWNVKRNWPLHLMVWINLVFLLIFAYYPMYGLVMAFQDFRPTRGFFRSDWVGLKNFEFLWMLPDTLQVIKNTIIISSSKIALGLLVPLIFALLLNEIRNKKFKRTVQTMVYLPYFLSWVILGGILLEILSIQGGIVNQALGLVGIKPIFFLGSNEWFRFTIVTTHVWKEFGFSSIIFLAALAGINPSLYEAAVMDGCGRWKQLIHITLPGIMPMVIVVGTLSLGNVLTAGFDQVFNLYNPIVYETGDIIDTYVYRMGLVDAKYSLATAMGLFNSVVSFVLVVTSYTLAYRFTSYRIF